MPDVVIDQTAVQLSSITAPGNTQDVTIPGFGTPTAAILLLGATGIGSSISNDAYWGVTFFDGTNIRSLAAFSDDNVANTDNVVRGSNERFIQVRSASGAIDLSCTLAFIADGIRFTGVTTNGNTLRVIVILIKGTSNVAVGSLQASTTVGGTASASIGFKPDLILFNGWDVNYNAGDGTSSPDYLWSFGIASRESSIIQRSMAYHEPDAIGTSSEYQIISDQYIAPIIDSMLYTVSLQSFDTSGFTVNTVAKGSTNFYMGYLAIKFSTNHPELRTTAITTGTGNKSFSSYSGTPTGTLSVFSVCPTMNSQTDTGDDVGAHCMSSMNSSGSEQCGNDSAIADNVSTTDCATRYPGSFLDLLQPTNPTGGTWMRGDYVSYDANGFTVNMSTNAAANTKQGFTLALIPGAPPSGSRVKDFMPFFNDIAA